MPTTDKAARDQSSIAFPYVDLDESIRLAGAILAKGGTPLDRDQLAVGVNMVPNSGAFGAKVGAARMFGLIEIAQAKYALTDLGFEILDAAREASAKARAFLNVPLYKKVFDDFKGKQLPPRPRALEQAFVSMGVAPKQKERARQIFDRSARSAGFFATAAEDRLVMPVTVSSPTLSDDAHLTPVGITASPPVVGAPSLHSLHPFIEGLLKSLPSESEAFPIERRAKWLELAANAFDMIYGQVGEIHVAAEPPAKS